MILKRQSQQKPPLTSEIQLPLRPRHSQGDVSLTTHQQDTQGTGCRHLTGGKQHTPQPRGRPWRCLPGGRAFCSAWGILQTRKGNEKGAWLYNCGQWQWGFQSWKLLYFPWGQAEKGYWWKGIWNQLDYPDEPCYMHVLFFTWHGLLRGRLLSVKSTKIPQIHEPANFKNKDPKSKYFLLCVPIISAATIQLFCRSTKAAKDNM